MKFFTPSKLTFTPMLTRPISTQKTNVDTTIKTPIVLKDTLPPKKKQTQTTNEAPIKNTGISFYTRTLQNS